MHREAAAKKPSPAKKAAAKPAAEKRVLRRAAPEPAASPNVGDVAFHAGGAPWEDQLVQRIRRIRNTMVDEWNRAEKQRWFGSSAAKWG